MYYRYHSTEGELETFAIISRHISTSLILQTRKHVFTLIQRPFVSTELLRPILVTRVQLNQSTNFRDTKLKQMPQKWRGPLI